MSSIGSRCAGLFVFVESKLGRMNDGPMKEPTRNSKLYAKYDEGPLNLLQVFRVALLLSVLLASQVPIFAQEQVPAEEQVPNILNKLYSLDFESAQEELESLTLVYPDDPSYWNLLASSIWLKILYEQEKLNLESYSRTENRSNDLDEFVDERMEIRLRSAVERAVETGTEMLSDERKKVDGFYALGVAHGTLASFEAVVKKAYFKANGEGKKAREYHLKVLEMDPSYADARLMIGTYDYFLGAVPKFVRLFLGLIGVRGEGKESGIQQLVYAAELGKKVTTNAKMMLVVIYNREKQYDRALSLLNELHAKYPRNFLMEMAKGSVYQKKKHWLSAIEVYRSVLYKIETGENGYDRFEVEPVLFKIGETHIHGFEQEQLDLDQALQVFGQIVLSDGSSVELKARSHLWMGKIWDSRDERLRALEQYEAVLGLDCAEEVQREAKIYLRRPFKD